MARKATSCTVQTRLDNGTAVCVNASRPDDPVNGATLATTQAAVTAAVAVLVADAASPTQAHVTTLNNAYTALVADISPVPGQASVVISYDAAVVVSRDTLRQAIDYLFAQLPLTL